MITRRALAVLSMIVGVITTAALLLPGLLWIIQGNGFPGFFFVLNLVVLTFGWIVVVRNWHNTQMRQVPLIGPDTSSRALQLIAGIGGLLWLATVFVTTGLLAFIAALVTVAALRELHLRTPAQAERW